MAHCLRFSKSHNCSNALNFDDEQSVRRHAKLHYPRYMDSAGDNECMTVSDEFILLGWDG